MRILLCSLDEMTELGVDETKQVVFPQYMHTVRDVPRQGSLVINLKFIMDNVDPPRSVLMFGGR